MNIPMLEEVTNRVIDVDFVLGFALLKQGKAKFLPEGLIDGKTLNEAFFGIEPITTAKSELDEQSTSVGFVETG